MEFTVQNFQDLLQLLDEHPEWRAELRRRVLTDELLDLPELVRRLTEAQTRTDEHIVTLTARMDTLTERVDTLTARVDTIAERLETLTARVDALTARVDALTAQMAALTQRVDALTAQMAALTQRVDTIAERLETLTHRVDANTGELMEMRYERRAAAYFSPLARRLRVLDRSTLADLLDDAVEQGRIIEAERQDLLLADLVLTGQRRSDRADVYLVVEVSVGVGFDDVRRAADRADVLAKLGRPVIAVVAGQRVDPDPAAMATSRGVWQFTDGRGVSPEAVA